MGVGVLVKVFYDLGKGDKIDISHIEVPAVIHNESSLKDSARNPKTIHNERERE